MSQRIGRDVTRRRKAFGTGLESESAIIRKEFRNPIKIVVPILGSSEEVRVARRRYIRPSNMPGYNVHPEYSTGRVEIAIPNSNAWRGRDTKEAIKQMEYGKKILGKALKRDYKFSEYGVIFIPPHKIKPLGSYHFTVTLPVRSRSVPAEQKKILMENFANSVQWFEPLILGMTGGPSFKKEGSVRHTVSNTIAMGSSFIEVNEQGRMRIYNTSKMPEWIKIGAKTWHGGEGRGDLRSRTGYDLEIRYFDQIPLEDLNEYLSLIGLLAAHSKVCSETGIKFKHVIGRGDVYNKTWDSIAYKVMKEGWDAKITEEEASDFAKSIGLKFNPHGTIRLTRLVKKLTNQLYKRYKNHHYYQIFGAVSRRPKLANLNREQMEYLLGRYMTSKPKRIVRFSDALMETKREPLNIVSLSQYTKIGKEKTFDILLMLERKNVVKHTGPILNKDIVLWQLTRVDVTKDELIKILEKELESKAIKVL